LYMARTPVFWLGAKTRIPALFLLLNQTMTED
jgi:hypothetical protein